MNKLDIFDCGHFILDIANFSISIQDGKKKFSRISDLDYLEHDKRQAILYAWYKARFLVLPGPWSPTGNRFWTLLVQAVFLSGVLLLFWLNTLKELMAILFADDMIVLFSGRTIQSVQEGLTETANKIYKYCQTWHVRINAKKCESILLRRPVGQMGNIKVDWRDFRIKINDVEIPNNNSVKYLGVHLDNLLRLDKHVNIQLEKANKVFLANTRLFHSAHFSQKAKIICCQLLIRPIITYAAPVCFNQSASVMEKMRKFERKCLRACVNLYRTPESNYKKYYSNKIV